MKNLKNEKGSLLSCSIRSSLKFQPTVKGHSSFDLLSLSLFSLYTSVNHHIFLYLFFSILSLHASPFIHFPFLNHIQTLSFPTTFILLSFCLAFITSVCTLPL